MAVLLADNRLVDEPFAKHEALVRPFQALLHHKPRETDGCAAHGPCYWWSASTIQLIEGILLPREAESKVGEQTSLVVEVAQDHL